jgi:hypothetical protein
MMTRKIALHVIACLLVVLFTYDLQAQTELSKWDKSEGFVLLFDGETSEGWRGYQKDFFPDKWIIEDGTLHFNPEADGSGGDIVYDKKFKNFHLKLEWKIAEGGNSGIFYLGSENESFNAIYRTAPEMQVLDNEKHPDAKLGTGGNRKAGSLYDLIPADPQNSKGAEKWNSAEVICKDGHVIHMQNGEKVVEYNFGTQMWSALVARSKFPGLNPDWVNLQEEGVIGLQDHGDHVWYRNIMIKIL